MPTVNVPKLDQLQIAVVGLGYVGLPLAVYLAQRFPVVGYDISSKRIAELSEGNDRTNEVTREEMELAKRLSFTADERDMASCNFYIVTVPTPIDGACRPDLTALQRASEMVGRLISKGDVVVYESTVYPGATEEVCIPIIERVSGLTFNSDFFAGYSPERANPGDHERRLPNIKKITSGSTPEAAELVDSLYATIITAGTHRASSIRVAEAAKVIENIQRDLNVALVNEIAQICKRLGIETREVLKAAETKWNFHGYQPGLVGGHCIGVDPYYLTYKAQSIGFHPEVILAGRRVNDEMAEFVAHDVVKAMIAKGAPLGSVRILIMGFTFKENCPDVRNTKVADLVRELVPFAREVIVYDPYADAEAAQAEYGISVCNQMPEGPFDCIILAVKHDKIVGLSIEWLRSQLQPDNGIIYDVKGVLPVAASDARL